MSAPERRATIILAAWRELGAYAPAEHVITVDGASVRVRPLLIAIATSRQYGNGALVAPRARLDDGRLDVVVVAVMPAPLGEATEGERTQAVGGVTKHLHLLASAPGY